MAWPAPFGLSILWKRQVNGRSLVRSVCLHVFLIALVLHPIVSETIKHNLVALQSLFSCPALSASGISTSARGLKRN